MRSVRVDRLSDGFDRVHVAEAPVPEPGPGQLRVRMRLSPVNPSDLNFVRGDYTRALERLIWNHGHEDLCYDPGRTQPSPKPPYSLGGEGVGIVDSCGPGVPEAAFAGRRVAVVAGPPMGAWQDYTIVAAQRALPVPDGLSDETAAMFIVNPLTAYAMVHEVLKVQAGTWLIQDAAGSALAKMVVRMSRLTGFRTINLVRGDSHVDALKALGADVIVDTDSQNVVGEVARATGGRGAEYALDCVGGELAGEMLRCLTLGGHMVVYGTLANSPILLPSRDMMMPVTRLSGFFATNWLALQPKEKLPAIFGAMGKLAMQGVFETPVDATYPLEQAREAIEATQVKGRAGKILLRIAD
jgi:NADPH2:quinone reductase